MIIKTSTKPRNNIGTETSKTEIPSIKGKRSLRGDSFVAVKLFVPSYFGRLIKRDGLG